MQKTQNSGMQNLGSQGASQAATDSVINSDPEPQADRRKGAKDRRATRLDRRNEDRVADDFDPRRNPELPDRRRS